MKRLAEVPTTALRIVTTLALIVIVVLAWLVGCLFMQRPTPGGLGEILTFLGVLSGVDAFQYLAKRGTFKSVPENGPDVEDAKAGATVKIPAAEPARPAPAEEAPRRLSPREESIAAARRALGEAPGFALDRAERGAVELRPERGPEDPTGRGP